MSHALITITAAAVDPLTTVSKSETKFKNLIKRPLQNVVYLFLFTLMQINTAALNCTAILFQFVISHMVIMNSSARYWERNTFDFNLTSIHSQRHIFF
jgi:hypothetical protein